MHIMGNNILDDLLGIDPLPGITKSTPSSNTEVAGAPPVKVPDPIVVSDSYPTTTQDDDLAFARRKMRNMIKAAEDAVAELSEIAASTQQPRAYEVLANLIKTTSEATKELVATHKTKAEINRLNNANMSNFDKQQAQQGNLNTGNQINVEKAVFVGTAADLMDHLDAKRKTANLEANTTNG
jgi:hypothetical protein